MKEDLIRKLTSRKFWVAVVGFVTGLLIYIGKPQADAEQIGSLIMMAASVVAYIFGEGWADSKAVHAYFETDEEPEKKQEEN